MKIEKVGCFNTIHFPKFHLSTVLGPDVLNVKANLKDTSTFESFSKVALWK